MKNTTTCYAWGDSSGWEALCVDFDLAAQGASLEEVRSELSDAIDTFLTYAAELPEPERARLLNRKAPVGLRLKLAILYRFSRLPVKLGAGPTYRYTVRPEVTIPETAGNLAQ